MNQLRIVHFTFVEFKVQNFIIIHILLLCSLFAFHKKAIKILLRNKQIEACREYFEILDRQ